MHKNRLFECPSCEAKLADAHLAIRDWFHWLTQYFPDVHVSISFRNETDQNKAFFEGKSKLCWPLSPHNHSLNGQACAKALDIFTLDEKGLAVFDKLFYEKVYEKTQAAKFPISWGGHFKSLGDYNHFQLDEEKDAN